MSRRRNEVRKLGRDESMYSMHPGHRKVFQRVQRTKTLHDKVSAPVFHLGRRAAKDASSSDTCRTPCEPAANINNERTRTDFLFALHRASHGVGRGKNPAPLAKGPGVSDGQLKSSTRRAHMTASAGISQGTQHFG